MLRYHFVFLQAVSKWLVLGYVIFYKNMKKKITKSLMIGKIFVIFLQQVERNIMRYVNFKMIW